MADREANRSGMRFRKRVLAFATGAAAVSALSLIVVGGPAVAGAAADPTVTPSPTSSGSSDNPFNVNDCDDFVADSSELFKANNDDSATDPDGAGSGEVSGGILTVTVNAGWVVTGVAVKGGPAANLYIGPFTGPIVITGMQPPINPN
ncbi:MAG TPA: hypothetical protein VK028_16695, partial [Micromonosporaceae bacterium]|nr:hypothetical protein [Micromonosporaceae bacterium]